MKLALKFSNSPDETFKAGEKCGRRAHKGLVCLYGPLGAGKTVFVRGLAKGLGVKSRVNSPTFTYQRVHSGRVKLYHFDFYRLFNRPSRTSAPDALLISDLHEALGNNDGIVVVEWAERIADFLPEKRTEIHIEYGKTEFCRKLTFKTYD